MTRQWHSVGIVIMLSFLSDDISTCVNVRLVVQQSCVSRHYMSVYVAGKLELKCSFSSSFYCNLLFMCGAVRVHELMSCTRIIVLCCCCVEERYFWWRLLCEIIVKHLVGPSLSVWMLFCILVV